MRYVLELIGDAIMPKKSFPNIPSNGISSYDEIWKSCVRIGLGLSDGLNEKESGTVLKVYIGIPLLSLKTESSAPVSSKRTRSLLSTLIVIGGLPYKREKLNSRKSDPEF